MNDGFIKAGRSIIATGTRPAVPSIPGIEDVDYLTSTSALSLGDLACFAAGHRRRLRRRGASANVLRRCVRVTIVCRSRLLPAAEPEIAEALSRYFRDEAIELHCGVSYQSVARDKTGVALALRVEGRDTRLIAERLLVATGRAPNVEGLGLKEARVAQASDGSIRVDDRMRTTRTGVYAAGDVTGRDQFVYMAAYGAKVAAKNALNGDSLRYDNAAMPAIVFTDPQVGSVGMTEAQARSAGHHALTSVLPLSAVPRALAARDTRGLIKLIADESRRLLGAHILAPEGADSIQTAALAIRQGLTVDDLADLIFPVSDDGRGIEARGTGLLQGRRETFLLRRLIARCSAKRLPKPPGLEENRRRKR